MKYNKRIPRISTRGFYDLSTSKTLKKTPYTPYPRKFFDNLGKQDEFTIVVHGMRNNKADALQKFKIIQKRLRQLGYKQPVVGFSYDSNVTGAQYKSTEIKATNIARMIAKKNACNLARFILDFKKMNPAMTIRLMGHSLGSEVILHTLAQLKHKKNIIESVYFFGSSIPAHLIQSYKFKKILQKTVRHKVTNYYSVNDQVLKHVFATKLIENPIGYCGVKQRKPPKYTQKAVKVKNHRFASYAEALKSFP